jgi:putative ABC transport system substrate-binding protein
MKSKSLLWLLTTVWLTTASIADAQQSIKIYRVGYLDLSSASGSAPLLQAFRQRLSDQGWVDGKNIAFEYRFADGIRERLPELAAELVRMKVHVVVVRSNAVALAAKQATSTIPIVMTSSTDPVPSGLVASLASPGGNITGLVSQPPGLPAKKLGLLKEIVPRLTRVGVLMPLGGGAGEQMNELKSAGPPLNITLQELKVGTEPSRFEDTFQSAVQKRVDAIIIQANPFFFGERRRITDLAAKNRLAAMYSQSGFVEVGGLMSYGTDITDLYRRAAVYVDKILKGAKPADLPIELPKKFELVINLKTAKQIGLTIPPNVLARADTVIK